MCDELPGRELELGFCLPCCGLSVYQSEQSWQIGLSDEVEITMMRMKMSGVVCGVY